jgi:hypothetical protein
MISTVLGEQHGILEVYYVDEKIEKFSLTTGKEEKKIFILSANTPFAIWINQQPAFYIKKIQFEKISKEHVSDYTIIENALHILLNSQPSISIKIYLNPFSYRDYELHPNLKVAGLKEMLKREWHWDKFNMDCSDGYPISSNTVKKIENKIVILDAIKDELAELNEEEEGRDSSSELSLRIIKFVNFENEIFIELNGQVPGLNLFGTCCNKDCNLEGKVQCVNKGYGQFDIKQECLDNKCSGMANGSSCKSRYISSCSLLNCCYEIDGSKARGEAIPSTIKQVQRLGIGLSFDASEQNTIQWKTLKMNILPLPFLQKEIGIGLSVKQVGGMCLALLFSTTIGAYVASKNKS